jgi:hypothetical protein
LARGFRRSFRATLRVALLEGGAAPRLSINPLGRSTWDPKRRPYHRPHNDTSAVPPIAGWSFNDIIAP